MAIVIRRYRIHLELLAFGGLLGCAISGAGFTDYGQIHAMFTFADLRLFLTFVGAVVLSGVGFAIHCRGAGMPRRHITRGTVPGSVLFGIGWAISGACPGAVLAQIGEGKLAAVVALGAVLVGTAIGQRIKGKAGWDSGTCGA